MSKVNFFKLTAAQYDSLENKDADTIYFLTDHKIIVLGAEKADKFLVNRVFAHDTYGTVAYLDANNSMDISGYFAEGISRFELWLVSATPTITGNIVLNIGGETFKIPVTGKVTKVVITPSTAVKGIISIVRDTASVEDTLNDGADSITAFVVDWRCC